jgi:hypothetical protein
MTRLRVCAFLGLLVAIAMWPMPGHGQNGATNGEWRAYSAEQGSTRYSPLDQINKDTVKNLQVAWTWKFDNFGTPAETVTTETTPIMVNGVLYFTAGQRRSVVAANAGTGETLWTWRPDEGERYDRAPRKVHRGVAYWTDNKGDERIVLVTPGFHLVSLNAKTGQPVAGFGQSGTVDLFKQLDLDVPLDPTGPHRQQLAGRDLERRHRRRPRADAWWSRQQVEREGRHHGVRRSERPQDLDVPHDSARRRTGLRNVEGRLCAVHGERRRVGTVLRRPATRLRISERRVSDE